LRVRSGDSFEMAKRFLRHSNGGDDAAMMSNITKKFLFDTKIYLTHEYPCEVYDGNIIDRDV